MRRRQPASRVRLKPEAVWSYLNRLNMSQNELAPAGGHQLRVPLAADERDALPVGSGTSEIDGSARGDGLRGSVHPGDRAISRRERRAHAHTDGHRPYRALGGELSQREGGHADADGADGSKTWGGDCHSRSSLPISSTRARRVGARVPCRRACTTPTPILSESPGAFLGLFARFAGSPVLGVTPPVESSTITALHPGT